MIRALLSLFLSVLFSATALAQCDFRSVYGGAYRESALDVTVDGGDLWVATSYGITLYDRSVSPPQPLTSIAIPGTTKRVEPAGAFVYVASDSSVYAVRKTGRALQIAGRTDLTDSINDLLYLPPYLYAATTKGVVQFDLLNPASPSVSARLNTSSGSALELARIGTTLYVADGDNTIDVFTLQIPTLPQKIGTFNALTQNLAVTAVGDRLYVSDGSRTNVFSGGGSNPAFVGIAEGLPSLSVFGLSGGAVFTAGSDRRLRALDYTDPAHPVTLFDTEVPFSSGTVNRIEAIAGADASVYVAAGDAGLLTYDVGDFKPPFPLRVNPVEGATSIFSLGSLVVSAPAAGGLRRYAQNDSGALTLTAQWPQSTSVWKLHDGASGKVLASSGATMTLWDVSVTPPLSVHSDVFTSPVASAILVPGFVYAVLNDHSVWKVDLAAGSGAPARLQLSDAAPSLIARGGSSIALADLTAAGTTVIRYFATGDPAAVPVTAVLEGSATSGLAASADGRVAVTTFRGLQIVDFRSGVPVTKVVAGTDTSLYSDVEIAGSEILLLTDAALEVRDLDSGALKSNFSLPGSPAAISYSPEGPQVVSIAAGEGIVSVKPHIASTQPELLITPRAERYFKKIELNEGLLLLTDGRSVDVMPVSMDGLPGPSRHIAPLGSPVDVAASGGMVYTITTGGLITGYSAGGNAAVELQIDEGTDIVANSLTPVAGALYVAITRGCLSGGCEKKTLVYQQTAGGLAETSSMPGALIDVSVRGTTAFAIFEGPDELRVLNLADPFHPTIVASRPSEGKPVSIDYASAVDTVYTLGDKLYGYSSTSLTKSAELLTGFTADPSGRLSYPDQTVRILGSCAIIAGRSFQPSIFQVVAAGQWNPVATPQVPAAVRSVAVKDGRIYLLSDYSLEIWSTQPIPGRKRPL